MPSKGLGRFMKASERKIRDLCSKLLTDCHRNSAEATEISNETATADPVSLSECENFEMNDVGIDTTDGAACNLINAE